MVSTRHRAIRIVGALLLIACISGSAALAAAPRLISAAWRMRHGLAGSFDVTLPLGGRGVTGSGIECRSVATGMMLVLRFDQPVVSGSATVSSGVARVDGPPTFDGNKMLVRLGAVADAQAITLTVTNVANRNKQTLAS